MESRNDDVPSVGRSNDDYITNTFYSAKLGLSNFFRLGRDWDERLGRETGTREGRYGESLLRMLAQFPMDTIDNHRQHVARSAESVKPTGNEVVDLHDIRLQGAFIRRFYGSNIQRVGCGG